MYSLNTFGVHVAANVTEGMRGALDQVLSIPLPGPPSVSVRLVVDGGCASCGESERCPCAEIRSAQSQRQGFSSTQLSPLLAFDRPKDTLLDLPAHALLLIMSHLDPVELCRMGRAAADFWRGGPGWQLDGSSFVEAAAAKRLRFLTSACGLHHGQRHSSSTWLDTLWTVVHAPFTHMHSEILPARHGRAITCASFRPPGDPAFAFQGNQGNIVGPSSVRTAVCAGTVMVAGRHTVEFTMGRLDRPVLGVCRPGCAHRISQVEQGDAAERATSGDEAWGFDTGSGCLLHNGQSTAFAGLRVDPGDSVALQLDVDAGSLEVSVNGHPIGELVTRGTLSNAAGRWLCSQDLLSYDIQEIRTDQQVADYLSQDFATNPGSQMAMVAMAAWKGPEGLCWMAELSATETVQITAMCSAC
jgi:hypothetical protein